MIFSEFMNTNTNINNKSLSQTLVLLPSQVPHIVLLHSLLPLVEVHGLHVAAYLIPEFLLIPPPSLLLYPSD